ncbi:PhoH family protein [Candidatus Saccharibacteria bacterium]|nr:PhoH family protein [Candidatus Saccharibacteria bacterium]
MDEFKDRIIYVPDTNILLDFIDIIPGEEGKQPLEPTVDLSKAHIVIPTVVERELSHFKNEQGERGAAAREVLRRLRALSESSPPGKMSESYCLDCPIEVPDSEMLISVLPVHKNFCNCTAFKPSSQDMDGQIILTAMVAACAKNDMPIDGTAEGVDDMDFSGDIMLLTNDNGLAIRARPRGIETQRYGYKLPPPYTGRRDIEVPKELFHEFYFNREEGISREFFEEQMPNEPRLVANEFIVMGLSSPQDFPNGFTPWDNPFFDNIGRYDAKLDKIIPLKYIRDFPEGVNNPGQAMYAEALMDPDIAAVVCTGPAGSGKTYMATVYSYAACRDGNYIGVAVVPCETRSDLGALPGDLDEKMDPEVQPLKDALRNFTLKNDPKFKKALSDFRKYGAGSKAKSKNGKGESDNSNVEPGGGSIRARLESKVDNIWGNWFISLRIEHARGRDFSNQIAIYDEFQDQNTKQADTLIKRIGADGKIILTGDVRQIHAPYLDKDNNGLVYASRLLYDNRRVMQVHFTEDEVVRHPLVKDIARRQGAAQTKFSKA